MEGRSKLKIGRNEAYDTDNPWPRLEVERSKVKVTRSLNAVTENQPYLPCITNFTLGIHGWSTMSRIAAMRGDLKAEKLWVAVQVTTCRGRGHIVAASLQAEQLVLFYSLVVVCRAVF